MWEARVRKIKTEKWAIHKSSEVNRKQKMKSRVSEKNREKYKNRL